MKSYTVQLDEKLAAAAEKLAHLQGISGKAYIIEAVRCSIKGDLECYVEDLCDIDPADIGQTETVSA